MSEFSERGYVVRETGPVYYTKDMDKTVEWFEETLGWYSEIDERNDKGECVYGCVYDTPPEFENLHLAPFTGIHLFYGDAKYEVLAFMKVTGIEKLHDFVVQTGWMQISDVTMEPWGSKVCTITTIDGYLLRFFE